MVERELRMVERQASSSRSHTFRGPHIFLMHVRAHMQAYILKNTQASVALRTLHLHWHWHWHSMTRTLNNYFHD